MVGTPKRRSKWRALSPVQLRGWHKAALALALAAVATTLALWGPLRIAVQPLENRVLDELFVWRGHDAPPNLPIVLVLVDRAALAPYPFRIPTPRPLLAQAVRRLDSLGARCIALDFLLDRPTLPNQDAALATALARSRAPVVVPVGALPTFARHAILVSPAIGLDAQGRARTIRYLHPTGKPPAMSWALQQHCTDAPLAASARFKRPIALDYLGPPSRLSDAAPTFPVISAAELKTVPRTLIAGRIVLVGSGEQHPGDTFDTPYTWAGNGYRQSYGVELHATALAMLLARRFLLPVPTGLLAVLLLVLFAFTAWTAVAGSLRGGSLLALALPAAWLALAAGLFATRERLLPVILPLGLALGVYLAGQLLRYFTEARYARFLRMSFSRYLSTEIVDELVAQRLPLALGGRAAEVTVLFADLENFTTLAKELAPEAVVRLLNAYFSRMGDVILAERGTIADFAGDGIMAYFGAPMPCDDHRERACRTALAMQTTLAAMVRDAPTGAPGIRRMRIGLHSGPVVIGNIGSAKRSDFTIVGDTVNVASRLEGVNKLFGTSIIASEAVRARNGADFARRELGRVVLKGRAQPTTLFEVLHHGASPGTTNGRGTGGYEAYQEALQAFYAGRLAEAQAGFEQANHAGSDPAARFMEGQCRRLRQAPLPADWNGALLLTAK